MQRDPAASVTIDDFQGLQTNVDPNDTQPGGLQECVNATCIIAGQLTVRGGMQPISFEN